VIADATPAVFRFGAWQSVAFFDEQIEFQKGAICNGNSTILLNRSVSGGRQQK